MAPVNQPQPAYQTRTTPPGSNQQNEFSGFNNQNPNNYQPPQANYGRSNAENVNQPRYQGYGNNTSPPPFKSPPRFFNRNANAYNQGPNNQYGQNRNNWQRSPYGNQYGNQYGSGFQSYDNQYHVPPARYFGTAAYQAGSPNQARPNTVLAPQGLNLPLTLQTAISTQVAKPGDLIQGEISHMVSLGGRGYIPAGTQLVGQVSKSTRGRRLSRSGLLSINFSSMRLPSGQQIPISAHIVGNIAKYKNKGSGGGNVYRGEGWGTKIGQTFLRGLGGAGLGAALGTGLGAIAGGRSGVGRGAWGGAAIGGGLGLGDMLLRKGKDVIIPSGTEVEIQLDQPAQLPSFARGPYGAQQGAF